MRFRIREAVVAIFFSVVSLVSEAATDAYKVPVADFSGVAGLQSYLTENLSSELKDSIRQKGLAVWAYTTFFETAGGNYCFASVGLTHAEAKNRNSRYPEYTFDAIAKRNDENWNAGDCRTEQLRIAIVNLNAKKLDELLLHVDGTQSGGGVRLLKKSDNEKHSLSMESASRADSGAVFKAIDEYPIEKVFDYRHVQVFISNKTMKFDSGEIVCIAIGGLTARSPEGRQSRWPASTVAFLKFDQKNDCSTSAAVGAVKTLLDEPWTVNGILNEFSRTREDSVPLPDVKAISKKRAALLEKKTKKLEQVESTQQNTVSCTNDCFNGSCVRTFPNGRKERWQAPRKFNPISGDWEWDVNSCGG